MYQLMICEILHYLTYLLAATHLYPKFLKVLVENLVDEILSLYQEK